MSYAKEFLEGSASHPNRSSQPDRLERSRVDQVVDTPLGASEDGGHFFDAADVGIVREGEGTWLTALDSLLHADECGSDPVAA
jgi:hypothetical protein